jgi:hypothetical protein
MNDALQGLVGGGLEILGHRRAARVAGEEEDG